MTSPTVTLPRGLATAPAARRVIHPDEPAPWLRSFLLATVVALLIGAGFAIGWVSGWRVEAMTTASMGTVAPVGSIVISHPVAAGSIEVGDVIVFHPPGQPQTTFVHRVAGVRYSGDARELSTRGDISGSVDPWTLSGRDVLGRVVVRAPAVGWLLRLLPWLAGGAASVLVLSAPLDPERRRSIRILGLTFVCVVAVVHFKPLVGFEMISSGPSGHGGQATVVPTGVLPVQLTAAQHAAGTVVLEPGKVGTVHAHALNRKGGIDLVASPHLFGWWWLVLLSWPVPLLAGLVQRRRAATPPATAPATAPDTDADPAGSTPPGA